MKVNKKHHAILLISKPHGNIPPSSLLLPLDEGEEVPFPLVSKTGSCSSS